MMNVFFIVEKNCAQKPAMALLEVWEQVEETIKKLTTNSATHHSHYCSNNFSKGWEI